MPAELIRFNNVTKELGDKLVLENINLTIEQGDILGIIGPSGSGKTTLLNTLIGFHEPDDGDVLFRLSLTEKLRSVHTHLLEVKKNFGFTSQVLSFYPKLTAAENVKHFGYLYGITGNVIDANMGNLFSFTHLEPHKHKLAEHLSGGQQRRLDIACGLIHRPRILIMDEPTSDLDPLLKEEMMQMIKEINKQGVTIILSSHYLDGIERICNRIVILNDGRIVEQGTMAEIKRAAGQSDVIRVQSTNNNTLAVAWLAQRLPIDEITEKSNELIVRTTETETALMEMVTAAKERRVKITKLDVQKPTLKEIFEVLTKK